MSHLHPLVRARSGQRAGVRLVAAGPRPPPTSRALLGYTAQRGSKGETAAAPRAPKAMPRLPVDGAVWGSATDHNGTKRNCLETLPPRCAWRALLRPTGAHCSVTRGRRFLRIGAPHNAVAARCSHGRWSNRGKLDRIPEADNRLPLELHRTASDGSLTVAAMRDGVLVNTTAEVLAQHRQLLAEAEDLLSRMGL